MKNHWIIVVLIALILGLLGGVYSLGYRVGPGLSLIKTQTLTIHRLTKGASVYVDLSPRGTSTSADMTLELIPGNHNVLVSASGYQPWAGLVSVPERGEAHVDAILFPLPVNIKPVELLGADAKSAFARIQAAQLPTASTTLSMADGCVRAYVSNNRLLATATTSLGCVAPAYFGAQEDSSTPIVVFSPLEPLRSVVSYPGRSDAFIIAAGTQVYALGLDPRSPQAFSKLVAGVAPVLTEDSAGVLFIADEGHAFSLKLPDPQ